MIEFLLTPFVALSIFLTSLFGMPSVGTPAFTFTSGQLASSPQADYILSTDGTNNSWIVNTGGGGTGTVGTSSVPNISELAYWTTSGANTELLSGVATTSATIGDGLSYSGTFGALVGGITGTLTATLGTVVDLASEVTGVLPDANVADDITIDSSTVVTAPNFVADSTTATSTFAGGVTIDTDFYFDPDANSLSVLDAETGLTITGVDYGTTLLVHGLDDTTIESAVHQHSNTASVGASRDCARSRGTEGAETAVQDGDRLCSNYALGHDGTDWEFAALSGVEVDGTVASNATKSRIRPSSSDCVSILAAVVALPRSFVPS